MRYLPSETALIILAPSTPALSVGAQARLTQLRDACIQTNKHVFDIFKPISLMPELSARHELTHWADTLEHQLVASAECIFVSSDIDLRLRTIATRVLIFAGGEFSSNIETNVRAADSLGYACYVASDTCSAYDPSGAKMLSKYASISETRLLTEAVAYPRPSLS